jgi:hypothetical protein
VTVTAREPGRTPRRVVWRRAAAPQPAEVPDLGPSRLDMFALAFAGRAESVLRHGLDVSYGESTRCTEPLLHQWDRVWRCEFESFPVWCAIDAPSHRALLEWILNGPGAAIPTAVERTIVSECVDRVLAPSVESRWRESGGDMDLPHDVWQRVLDVSGEGTTASLRLYTAAEADPHSTPAPLLDDVPIDLEAQLQPFAVRFSALLCWGPGAMVRVSDSPDAIRALLRVAGGPEVFGRLGCADGCRAIRLDDNSAR